MFNDTQARKADRLLGGNKERMTEQRKTGRKEEIKKKQRKIINK